METDAIEDPENSLEVSPAELTAVVIEGAKVYAELTEQFIEQFEFYGMTLREWADEMFVKVPDRLDEQGFRDKIVEVMSKTQRASNYLSVASSLAKAFGSGSEIRKSDIVSAIVANYSRENKKRPAGAVIERMADSYLKSTVSTRIAAGIVRDFWKTRVETLDTIRRLLDSLGMSLHVEMKHTSS